ncbi:ArsR/SmtB family transcription factor [Pseudonocardia parietis]|uniref:DNA-binding transcriptional ArsR family regulator n=1 Tax=Pseudonocardia parietis TaxID=570936 RepID=A0ABS4W747_9PSEU|nr:metalloregulator ArsR/SmtB family transcription factor [Pseudonocardia parietis]MBP2372031.1 DNA-binding transcriptional ArsR family regulator [Pseudonocardia parietis]
MGEQLSSHAADLVEDQPLDGVETVAGAAAELFKALADPLRLQLVGLARQAPDAELCFCDLIEAFPQPQSTLSHHLSVLVKAGVMSRERRGTWSWYRLEPDLVDQINDALSLDGMLHQLLRLEHADNPKLISRDGNLLSRCEPPATTDDTRRAAPE